MLRPRAQLDRPQALIERQRLAAVTRVSERVDVADVIEHVQRGAAALRIVAIDLCEELLAIEDRRPLVFEQRAVRRGAQSDEQLRVVRVSAESRRYSSSFFSSAIRSSNVKRGSLSLSGPSALADVVLRSAVGFAMKRP